MQTFSEPVLSLQKHGRSFDFVFGDLTDIPVTGVEVESSVDADDDDHHPQTAVNGGAIDFHRKVLSRYGTTRFPLQISPFVFPKRALRLVKPSGGRYLAHCNGKSVPQSMEKLLKTAKEEATDTRRFTVKTREAFVASFMEIW